VVAGNGLLLALFILWMPFHWGGPTWVAPINDLTNVLLGLSLVALAWRASTTVGLPTHMRRGWQLFALGCLAYWLGNCRWLYNEVVLAGTPFPSLADVGYLAFIPLALTAILSFVGPIESRAEHARIWIDAATVTIGIGAAIWYFLIYPIYASAHDSRLELLIAEAYPVGDTLLIFGVSALVCLFRRNWTAIPAQTGHPIRRKLDGCSRRNWTVGAKRRTGWMLFTRCGLPPSMLGGALGGDSPGLRPEREGPVVVAAQAS
jgi:hypothetical protein